MNALPSPHGPFIISASLLAMFSSNESRFSAGKRAFITPVLIIHNSSPLQISLYRIISEIDHDVMYFPRFLSYVYENERSADKGCHK